MYKNQAFKLVDYCNDILLVSGKLHEKELSKCKISGLPKISTAGTKELGTGAYASVYKVIHNGCVAALKVFHGTQQNEKKMMESESKMMIAVQSTGVAPRLYGMGMVNSKRALLVSFHGLRGPNSTIFDLATDPHFKLGESEQFWKSVFYNVAEGLEKIHACGVIHCDIKIDNIIVENTHGHVKIIDFGLATFPHNAKLFTLKDGANYLWIPEEVYTDREKYSIWSDVYAFGNLISDILQYKPHIKTSEVLSVLNGCMSPKPFRMGLMD